MLKEINPEYLLERLQLKMNTLAMQRADLMEKTLMLGKIKGKKRREQQRVRWLDSITNSMDMNLSKLPEIVENRGAWRHSMGSQRVGHDLATELQ